MVNRAVICIDDLLFFCDPWKYTYIKKIFRLRAVAHTLNLVIQEADIGRILVQGFLGKQFLKSYFN
jgi:hypothetical protein